MDNYKAQAERTDEAERLLTPPFRKVPADKAGVTSIGSWAAFAAANRSRSKWAPLIEQCEMGNEAGAEKVLQLLREGDKMADTLRGIRAAMQDNGGYTATIATIADRLNEWELAQ